jgi:hypothetical protein
MIDHVQLNGNGNRTGRVRRDPFGSYRTITDVVRFYVYLGHVTLET